MNINKNLSHQLAASTDFMCYSINIEKSGKLNKHRSVIRWNAESKSMVIRWNIR